jgi:hypothetical protein
VNERNWNVVVTGEGCEDGQIVSTGLTEQEANDHACDLAYRNQMPGYAIDVADDETCREAGIE